MKLRVLDLFSGIGGFSLGLKRAGWFQTVAYCEINPYCQAVLQARMRDGSLDTAPICTDITKLDGTPWRGRVDAITGGFPCPDISNAGANSSERLGLDGARSGLWREMLRLVRQVRPVLVIVENVSALLVRGIERVLGGLAESGYDAVWECLPAGAFGAPHVRDRIFVVAHIGLQRIEGCWKGPLPRLPEFSWCQDVRGPEDLRGRPDLPTPLFRGSRDGVPAWVDRVGACGNSIIPGIAEWIGRRVNEAQKMHKG